MAKASKSGACRKPGKPNLRILTPEVEILAESAREFVDSAKSKATKTAYRSDWASFVAWCDDNHFVHLPASPTTVALYITWMAKQRRAASTISRALTSISQAHKYARFDTPTRSLEVVEVNKGIRRTLGTAQRRARPLVLADLKKTINATRPTMLGRRDRALLLVGWAAAMRRSEIVALDLDHIDFVAEGMIVNITRSKTDQEGEGYKIGIPFAQDDKCCPVKILKHWIDLAEITEGPLFFMLGISGRKFHTNVIGPKRLSAKYVNNIIKKRVSQAGINPAGYSGHSLRAGFVTSAASNETPEHLIQLHTRHRSTKTLRGYIREGGLFTSNPLSIML